MKKRFTMVFTLATLALCALLVAGCSTQPSTQAEEEAKTQNRQYMATLNQQMTDLQKQMDTFSTAVSEDNLVSMNAQVTAVGTIIDTAKQTEAPDALKDTKTLYVDALNAAYEAMQGYVSLYTEAQKGAMDEQSYADQLKIIQDKYDQSVDKLKEADDKVTELSKGQ